MSRNLTAILLAICANIAPQLACAAPVSGTELKFREQMGLVDYQAVEYRDTKGAVISFAEFERKQASAGFSMEKKKSGQKSTAVLKLESANSATPIPKSKLVAGKEFPAFKLAATDGSLVDNEALHGRYTLVSFYFADCAPCIKEVPMLNAFAQRNKAYGTLAVTFDSSDEAKKFVQRTGFGWRTLANAKELIDRAGVKAYPTIALLDAKGVVVATTEGLDAKGNAIDNWVAKAIAGRVQ
ncbi:TlpA disulfide reductase family protein [Massilia sp. SR12]